MKKTLAVILGIIAVLACFTACGGTNNGKSEGTYAGLYIMNGVELGVENYAIAFRKGSDMVAKADEITARLFSDGTIKNLANTYELSDSIVTEFKASTDSNPSGESDLAYIQSKGKLVVGITDFKPMDYRSESNEWIGFDADYAKALAKDIGVDVEFKEIVWENKLMELDTKSIDCIWNGMTVTPEVELGADITGAYIKNYQVVVIKDSKKYTSLESLSGKTVVAEAGSAGEAAAKENASLSSAYKAVESQADALLQVKSGQADACVIDYVMAKSMLGK